GIHASPTCVMNYENATGWLVGEKHKGMRAMFTMMNAARLYVGIQGLGLGEVAYQNALAYANERLQGRSVKGAKFPDKPADPIIAHPDVRRNLLLMRSFCEGGRALALETALMLDLSRHHPDAKEREKADDYVQLMTPIVKSWLTDGGFEVTNLGMQIFGGMGYIRETGMEQYARDARIAQIYEGTNGIQALDLVGRKLSYNMGRYLRRFFHPASAFIEQHKDDPKTKDLIKPFAKYFSMLQQTTLWMAKSGVANPEDAMAAASEYLRLFALVVLGYAWCRMGVAGMQQIEKGRDVAFHEAKLANARFYLAKVLPQAAGLASSLTTGGKTIMDDKAFSA
ncbi:MAG: acyl-CoA dehydrogenase C-terminal domain-containing protein, partial [Alphaproteobacteria bacterium]|nr:acyl-CoA dehydrogenase C-terminal domain-containing protein [Alphaproteobacteria bacterium]